MALGVLLQQVGPICETINGVETAASTMTPLHSGISLPKGLRRYFRGTRRLNWELFYALDTVFDLSHDFLEVDASRSVESFLRLKNRFPVLREIYRKFENCEMVVINGEGTYIFTQRPRRDTLFYNFSIALAKRMGKQVCVVNAMFSDEPAIGCNQAVLEQSVQALREADLVTARDSESYAYMRDRLREDRFRYIPDALFTWSNYIEDWKTLLKGKVETFEPFGSETLARVADIDLQRPYIAISGSSAAAREQKAAYEGYKQLVKQLQPLGLPLLLVPTCGGDQFLEDLAEDMKLPSVPLRIPIRIGAAILGKAEVFVSGRFHPSIMASCGGTPCVFLGSNSHKTRSLQRVLEYDGVIEHPAIPDADAHPQIRQQCEALLAEPQRETVSAVAKRLGREALQVVDALTAVRAGS
ncbi:MAG: hypothetical protein E1N59_2075 [Puniceicoccaceae bacterium 5H]|nr:MAG: hypothetical protein E1N59_2075 [Puniceicoccaceae bacterium 5H]